MDTKLKNYHKLAAVIIALIILLPSLAMMVIRPNYLKQTQGNDELDFTDSEFIEDLVTNTYILYKEELQGQSTNVLSPFDVFYGDEKKDSMDPETLDYAVSSFNELYDSWKNDFGLLRSYMEYEVLDAEKKTVLDTNRPASEAASSLYESLNRIRSNSVLKDTCDYAFVAVIEYGEKGVVKSTSFFTHKNGNSSQILNETSKEIPMSLGKEYFEYNGTLQTPENRIYCFAMTQDSIEAMMEDYGDLGYDFYPGSPETNDLAALFLTLLGIVGVAALCLPFIRPLHTGNEKCFHMPLELVLLIGFPVFGISTSIAYDPYTLNQQSIYSVLTSIGLNTLIASVLQYLWGLFGWIIIFAVCYWSVGCLRHIFTMGPKAYMKQRVIIYRIWPWLKRTVHKVYDNLLHVDLKEDSTKTLLKIVLVNFVILGFISLLWIWGIGALIIYSVILFLLLRNYTKKIQAQYQLLLGATNELAKGNLNGTIPSDLGIFEPFREEIDKIQSGFKKAVDEEVKSTKMKTDLITNVSHDLKTPLTSIITYVDLLKQEDLSPEEQKKYIEILDQKSKRLKFLIEDLFEISKATSKNVSLNIMDIDIVSLLHQVKLELQDKIDATDLAFRWQLPEEKVILPLDSQRTYRVFENLLVNITKYAMPHTRVYINMENTENHVKIIMKNISAAELNFNPNEITERFVRGDSSRNTEGSGLGLAIAKSFTELQGGRLEVSVDADLFTVEITFLKPHSL